ncbi:MAG: NAD(+) synthase, partial [Clostridium sp.]|nr:NAD(+) synthase [Clostridium sp.]
MRDGFIRVAAVTPKIRVADPEYNAQQIIDLIHQGYSRGVKLMVFPELCLTAYTCSDLFFQSSLLEGARKELGRIISATKDKDILVFLGMPWEREGKLYNVAAVIQGGRLLGLVPKKSLPNYSEFYEARHFCPGNETPVFVPWEDRPVPMGMNLLFRCANMKGVTVGAE